MDLEDFLEPEVGIAAAVVAAIATPQVRNLLRRGAVYGLAGVLIAGDAVGSFAKGLGQGAQNVAASTAQRMNVQSGNANGATTDTTQTTQTTSPSEAEAASGEMAGGEG